MPPSLLALSPGELSEEQLRSFLAALRAAIGSGLRGLVLREARLGDRAYLDLAREIRASAPRGDGLWLCVHDRAHLASAAGADAVHLAGSSLPPREVRAWLAPHIALGLSTHAEDDPRTWRDVDYVVHGPVRETPKPRPRAPIGFDGLANAAARAPTPVWALGGIRPEDVPAARAAGAAGVAVLSGIFGQSDPSSAVRAYLAAERACGGT